MLGIREGAGITIFRRNTQVKKYRLEFEPVPTASKPCCRTHYATGTIGMEFLTNVSEIIKIFGTTDSNPDLPLQTHVILPTMPSEPLEWNF